MIGLNPWLLLVALCTTLAAFGSGYLKGSADSKSKQVEQALLIEQASRKAQEAAAEAISQIKIEHKTIQRRVEREVLEKPVYRACSHDDDSLQLINSALANKPNGSANLKLPRQLGRAD